MDSDRDCGDLPELCPPTMSKSNTYCTECNKSFSSRYSLQRHKRIVHSPNYPYHLNIQHGGRFQPVDGDNEDSSGKELAPPSVDMSESSGSDSESESDGENGESKSGQNGESESDEESDENSESEENIAKNDSDEPQFNRHDFIVGKYLINLMKLSEADAELEFVQEFYILHSHLRRSNLHKVLKDAITHFTTQLELMSKSEALKAGIDLRSSFILMLLKKCNKSLTE